MWKSTQLKGIFINPECLMIYFFINKDKENSFSFYKEELRKAKFPYSGFLKPGKLFCEKQEIKNFRMLNKAS